MEDKTTAPSRAVVSVRWTEPTQPEGTCHYVSYLKYKLTDRDRAAGCETRVYGPDRWSCVAEAHRQDTLWTVLPVRRGDSEGHARRVEFLRSGGADGDADTVPHRSAG